MENVVSLASSALQFKVNISRQLTELTELIEASLVISLDQDTSAPVAKDEDCRQIFSRGSVLPLICSRRRGEEKKAFSHDFQAATDFTVLKCAGLSIYLACVSYQRETMHIKIQHNTISQNHDIHTRCYKKLPGSITHIQNIDEAQFQLQLKDSKEKQLYIPSFNLFSLSL